MKDIVLRTTPAALMLLIMPAAVWLSGWLWHPVEMGPGYTVLLWITETVSSPWGTFTSIVLCGWFIWCLKLRLKSAMLLSVIMISTILLGQFSAELIKKQVQEPRPYIVWLKQYSGLNEKYFYQQKKSERSVLIRDALTNNRQLPIWLKRHWESQTSYAFPSGHAMFSASWALLGVGLLWPRGRVVTIVVLSAWAVGVMASRLVLGMHWPRDLIGSTLISWLLVILATWLVQHYCGPLSESAEKPPGIASREGK